MFESCNFFTKMLNNTCCVFIISCFFITIVKSKEIPPVAIAEEVGKGIGKIAFHLDSLINECEPPSLLEWYEFMEKYLECKEAAAHKATYDEYLEMPNLTQVEKHCTTWPKIHKCNKDLASTLDNCYEKMNGMKKKGSDALRFADAFSRYICQHKHQYLENVVSNTEPILPADRRPMKCYIDRRKIISECAEKKFKEETSPNLCRNIAIVRECFEISYNDCESLETKDFIMAMLKRVSSDLHCA